MAYTKGVLEKAIQAIQDRLVSHTTPGSGKLKDIKSIVVGYRPRETGDNAFPRIIINIVDYSEDTVTMANSAGQKSGSLKLEFRIECEKLKNTTDTGAAANNLFDGAGGGALAIYQWFVDSLVYTAGNVYTPVLDLALDAYPDASFITDESGTSIDIIVNYTFKIRYTNGAMGGVLSA